MKHEDGMQLAASLADFWVGVTANHLGDISDLAIFNALSDSAREFHELTHLRRYATSSGLIEAAERTRLRIPPLFEQMVRASRMGLAEQVIAWQAAFGALATLANTLEVMAGNEPTLRITARAAARS